MMSRGSKGWRLIIGCLLAFGLAREANAYIDPNSAGLLYQIFFPLIVAVTLAWRWVKETVKMLWYKVTRRTG